LTESGRLHKAASRPRYHGPLCGDPKNLIKAHDRAVVVAEILAPHSQQDRALRVEK